MLKQMRRRVILAAMAAFASVILLIAVLVNVVNFYVVTNRADDTITSVLSFQTRSPKRTPNDPPPEPFMGLPDLESNYMTRFFIVSLDTDGNVLSVSTDQIATIDGEEAVRYAKQALSRKADRGYMKAYRYLRETNVDAVTVVFLNVSRDLQYMRSLRNLTVIVAFGSLVVVFLLVALLSGKAIKPIARNIERQKQFITDASHELKTPLTSISTSVDVIELEHGSDEWTDNIRKQTGRMSKLVSELVTLSRLDEEIPLPNKEHFSLSSAAWEIADVYAPQAKAHDKTFTTDIQENVSVFGEKAAVQQMLSVLLDNAIRYSDPQGEIRFSVVKKHGRAQIEVFNTCRMETPPDTERLFDRFYRPDTSRSTASGGTGVGLAIAKAAAEAHGGTITASCPSGKTMTITVVL